MSVVDAVDVLGDAHAPDEAGSRKRRLRVPAGGLGDVARGHAGDALGVVQRVRLERTAPRVEALGALADEALVVEPLVDDHARHRVEEGHVGAGALGEPEVGLVAQLHALGVDDDQARAAAHGTTKADGDHRVVRGRVGADHHEAARFFVVLVRVGRRARAHGGEHRLHRGRVAEARAVVDVVGGHDHAAELLHEVAVFVGGLGAGERAEAAAVLREAVGGGVERLVPARLVPAAVALDHRSGDPVARVDETGGEASLHAEHAEARGVPGRIVGHQREAAVVAHLQLDPAAHAAVGAGGRDRPGDLARRFLGPQRARRARGHALAARRAHRRGHRPVAEDADLGGVAAAQERDGPDLLDVVARDGAAAAEDAGVAVEDEERLARVLVVGVQRRPRRLEPAVAGGGVAELPETIPGCSCEGG